MNSRSDLAVHRLERWWVTERVVPYLLPLQRELVDEVSNQVRDLQVYVEEQTAGNEIPFEAVVVETELERVKFVLRGYARARISKIDQHLSYYLENPLHLTTAERRYAQKHYELLRELYRASFLDALPADDQEMDDEDVVVPPDMSRPVAVRVIRDIEHPIEVGGDIVELRQGGTYFLRYDAVAEAVENGSAELL